MQKPELSANDQQVTNVGFTGNRVCEIALAVLWHQFLWSGVCWMFYYVLPECKEILSDFEIENPPFVESVIRTSDFVVIWYHLVPLFLLIVIAIDSAAMWFLRRKPLRRMIWFLAMSALPFFMFVYGVFGVSLAFQFMAVQMALEHAQ